MSLLTINGSPIIKGTIRLPRVGVWHADLTIDIHAGISGAVTIATADNAFSLKGTVFRQGIFSDTLSMRIIGGAGGLSTGSEGIGPKLSPKFFQGVTVNTILLDILTTCGEKLSPKSDAATLALARDKWVSMPGSGKRAVRRLLDDINASWRIIPDGTFWVGTDKYPPSPKVQFDVIDRYYGEGRIIIGSQQPFLLPGTTIIPSIDSSPQKVSYVVHEIEASTITSEVFFENS